MRFGRPTLRLGAAGFALLMATCAPTVRAGTLAESPLTDDTDSDAARDDGGALATETKATALGRLDPPCFPVSVTMWAPRFPGADTDVTGWGSVDRTARVEGRTCEVKGWAPIESCGRTIPAYSANCPDGAFTFTKTEADCYYVLGCRLPQEASAVSTRERPDPAATPTDATREGGAQTSPVAPDD